MYNAVEEGNLAKNPCCRLGAELFKNNVLYQTQNFFVVPALGPIGIEGYLLINSKRHYEGIGEIPPSLYDELRDTIRVVNVVLHKEYGGNYPFVFEQGPRVNSQQGGVCLDHAHLHVVPNLNLAREVIVEQLEGLQNEEYVKLVKGDWVRGFRQAHDIYQGGIVSYILISGGQKTETDKVVVIESNRSRQSQYIRKKIANKVGRPYEWSWKTNPDMETLERTVMRLKDKFPKN